MSVTPPIAHRPTEAATPETKCRRFSLCEGRKYQPETNKIKELSQYCALGKSPNEITNFILQIGGNGRGHVP